MATKSFRQAAAELAVLSSRLTRIAIRFAEANGTKLQLSWAAYRALRVLQRRGASRMSHLAEVLMLSKQTTSQTVDGLVGAELVTRGEDPDDRRHMVVTATATGLVRLQAYDDHFDRHLQGLFIDMDDPDATRIASALHQLNREISAKRDAGYFKTRRKQPRE